jgi:hypothetical protein
MDQGPQGLTLVSPMGPDASRITAGRADDPHASAGALEGRAVYSQLPGITLFPGGRRAVGRAWLGSA